MPGPDSLTAAQRDLRDRVRQRVAELSAAPDVPEPTDEQLDAIRALLPRTSSTAPR